MEFYDLAKDPQELSNLAAKDKYSYEINRLKKILDKWYEYQHDTDMMATERAASEHMLPSGLRKLRTARCGGER